MASNETVGRPIPPMDAHRPITTASSRSGERPSSFRMTILAEDLNRAVWRNLPLGEEDSVGREQRLTPRRMLVEADGASPHLTATAAIAC